MIFTREYWSAALERALSAGAASATGGLGVDAVNGFDLDTWKTVSIAFVIGFVFSVLKGLAANAKNGGLGPGIGGAEVVQPAIVLPAEDGTPRGEDSPTVLGDDGVVGDVVGGVDPKPSDLMVDDIDGLDLAPIVRSTATDEDRSNGIEVSK